MKRVKTINRSSWQHDSQSSASEKVRSTHRFEAGIKLATWGLRVTFTILREQNLLFTVDCHLR